MLGVSRCLLIASLFFLIAPGLEGSDVEKDVKKALENRYEHKTFIIRHFYVGNHLKYDSEGALITKAESGPWSLYGFFQIDDLALKQKKIELKGKRLYWRYNSGDRSVQYIRIPDRIRIEILYRNFPRDLDSIQEVLNKVLLPDVRSLHEEVPDYWEKIVMNIYNGKNIDLTKLENKCEAGPFYAPEIISKPDHMLPYTEFARKAKIEGTIRMRATTDKDGNIIINDIISPLGVGLDERAIEFFSKWKSSPARCQNQPVEWEGIVEVSFNISE